MREIREDVAKDCLPQLLVIVEQGEPIAITRDGQTIARLLPVQEDTGEVVGGDEDNLRKQKALAENYIQWRAQQEPVSESLQDILNWRSSDHR